MCGCKKRKKGSGVRFLSGATWKGYGPYKKGSGVRRKRRKKAAGMSFRGQGINFTGQGVAYNVRKRKHFHGTGGKWPYAYGGARVSVHRTHNGKRVL